MNFPAAENSAASFVSMILLQITEDLDYGLSIVKNL